MIARCMIFVVVVPLVASEEKFHQLVPCPGRLTNGAPAQISSVGTTIDIKHLFANGKGNLERATQFKKEMDSTMSHDWLKEKAHAHFPPNSVLNKIDIIKATGFIQTQELFRLTKRFDTVEKKLEKNTRFIMLVSALLSGLVIIQVMQLSISPYR